MRDNEWRRVNQSPEVSPVVVSRGGESVPRVELRGREFRIGLTPSGAEKLAERLHACAAQARRAHKRHGERS